MYIARILCKSLASAVLTLRHEPDFKHSTAGSAVVFVPTVAATYSGHVDPSTIL